MYCSHSIDTKNIYTNHHPEGITGLYDAVLEKSFIDANNIADL
jgi:hypothetical protein